MLRHWAETILVLAATLLVTSCFAPSAPSNMDTLSKRLAGQLGMGSELQVVARESDNRNQYSVVEDSKTALLVVSAGGKIIAYERCSDLRHEGHVGCGFMGTGGAIQGIYAVFGFRKDSTMGVRITIDGSQLTLPLSSQGGFLYVTHSKSNGPLTNVEFIR